MGMMINRRRAMGGKSLPYDAEIDYLRSTGTQYIDSGIEVDSHLSVGFSVKISASLNAAYCGAIQMSPMVRHHGNASTLYMYNGYSQSLKLPVNTWGDFTLDTDNRLATLNGVSVSFNVQEWSINANYGIFGRLADTGQIQTVNAKVDFASFKLWRNNKTLRDFIPVRIGTTGYLYDKVSGQLFGNKGTGAFILGPDKGIKNVNINVKTHSVGDYDASLDVITENRGSANILYTTGAWANGYIQVVYQRPNWRLSAITPCLYDGQVYQSGDLIATWNYRETKDINIVANI